MIKLLTWQEIFNIWQNYLWPNRTTPIKTHSAMLYLNGYDMNNYAQPVHFLGYFINSKLVGVNSAHSCTDGSFRSRGLWVDPEHRGKGIGQALLRQTIELKENATFIWSYPRQSSWNTYNAVGFQLASNWQASDTSEANAYCRLG